MHTLAKRMSFWAGAVTFVLVVPLFAMQVTNEVDWDQTDFIVMGVLLLGSGFLYELLSRTTTNTRHRIVIGAAVAITLLLVWAELAVGVFGTPFVGS